MNSVIKINDFQELAYIFHQFSHNNNMNIFFSFFIDLIRGSTNVVTQLLITFVTIQLHIFVTSKNNFFSTYTKVKTNSLLKAYEVMS